MAAPTTTTNSTAINAAADPGASPVNANAPLTTAAGAAVAAVATAATNVWPNTRDSYELREVIEFTHWKSLGSRQ